MSLKSIVITAAVTGVVSLSTGFILYIVQLGGFNLEYKINDVVPFAGNSESVAIYRIDVHNAGLKMAEEVSLSIDVPDPETSIKQAKIDSEALIKYTEKIEGREYQLNIENLNPKESFSVSLLAVGSTSMSAKPKIVLRAKNVLGKEVSSLRENLLEGFTKNSLVTVIATYAAVAVMVALRRKNPFDIFGVGDQQDNLLYLSSVNGMTDELSRYSETDKNFTYRLESDRLTSSALLTQDRNKAERVKALLLGLIENVSGIATSSKAVVYYNVARIYKFENNQEKATELLKKAQKMSSSLVKQRMKIEREFWDPLTLEKLDK